MSVFRLAHLSDPHLGPLPSVRPLDLASKRIFGYLNWHGNRRRAMESTTLERLTDDIARSAPDHVAVTGDLVNIALPEEFDAAAGWLESLGPPRDVSVVPGNHDAYVPGALQRAVSAWSAFLSDDQTGDRGAFPFVRVRPPVAIVGVSTAVATPPLLATGWVGEAQAKALVRRLEILGRERLFRIVLIHHPPIPGLAPRRKRLVDAWRVRRAVGEAGCELILHGHTHLASIARIEGAHGAIPVVGVPSASESGHHGEAARWNLFEIGTRKAAHACVLVERGARRPGEAPVELTRHVLA